MKNEIYIPFTIDGKDYQIPTSWYGVTLRQWKELRKWNKLDRVELLSIITGVPYEQLYRANAAEFDEKLAPYLKFLEEGFPIELARKIRTAEIEGKQYPINSKSYTYGQSVHARHKAIAEGQQKGDPLDQIEDICAIYFFPLVTGKDYPYQNYDAVTNFGAEVLLDCSCMSMYACAKYYLETFEESKVIGSLPGPFSRIKNKRLREYITRVFQKSKNKVKK